MTAPAPRNGRVAAVTGAARGIGRATAVALGREGYRVALGDLDADLAAQAAAATGAQAVGLDLNVAEPRSFARFLERAEACLGPVDVLVNNAGIMHVGRFLELDEDATALLRTFHVNVFGVAYGMRLALPGMLERGRGHVVNLASVAGRTGYPGAASYCASKHAVLGLSEAVRAELRGTPVALTVVLAGVVRTELAEGLARGRGERWLEPEEVAAAVAAALRRPRPPFEVFVPRWLGVADRVGAALPRRWREAVARAIGADRAFAAADPAARAAYEQRAAQSGQGSLLVTAEDSAEGTGEEAAPRGPPEDWEADAAGPTEPMVPRGSG